MAEFQTPVDVASFGLQLCGQARIDPVKGFTEPTRGARETSFAYGKLRRAELQRNTWRCAVKMAMLRAIDANTRLLTPALWSPISTYFANSIVSDQNNNLWISNTPNNLKNDPLASLTWEPYFGPLTVSLYATATSYHAGELVYKTPGDGTYRTYLSLQDGNSDDPAVASAYDATAVYTKNQVVTFSSVAYMGLIDFNTGNTPSAAPTAWNVATTYTTGNAVAGSDGVKYVSVGSGNVGNDPTLDVAGVNWTNTGVLVAWTAVFTGGTGSNKWLQIGGVEFPSGVALTSLGVAYSPGTGPSSQASTRNVYRLPNGFLRLAPQNPKATTTWLGGPSGNVYSDWSLQGDYLITGDSGPIPLRFVADLTDVRRMDDLLCVTLGYRVAIAVCDTLTQSASQLANIEKAYSVFRNDAATVNAIEMGYDDPPDDDYVTVRY
jgi:hypothetical protein